MKDLVFNNIFSNKQKSLPATSPSITFEDNLDFDISESMMEALMILEESYFEINRDHMYAAHVAYKDDNVEILTEGFKDFANSVVKFFANMIKKLREFTSRAFMYIRAYMGNFEKFINKYKDKLSKLNPDFKINGYQYTISPAVPNLAKIDDIVNHFNSDVAELDKLTKVQIVKDREEFNRESNISGMRAYVLGANASISKTEFVETAHRSFRNNAKEPVEITVNKALLNTCVNQYADTKKSLREVSAQRDKTITLLESIKEFFNKGVSVHYKGDNTKVGYVHNIKINDDRSNIVHDGKTDVPNDTKRMDILNTFYNFKWTQSKEIGYICVTVLTEKVNAIKEQIKQSENIIRKSIFGEKNTAEGGAN